MHEKDEASRMKHQTETPAWNVWINRFERHDVTGWPERSSRTKQPESPKARRWNNARKRIRSRVPHSSTGSHSGPRKTKLQQKANHRGKALSRRESQGESRLNGTSNERPTSARKFHSGENGALGDALEDIRGRLGRPWGRRRRPRRTCWGSLGFPGGARDIREFFG